MNKPACSEYNFYKKWLYGLTLLEIIIFTLSGLFCYWSFSSSIIDYGTFNQVIWMVSKGMWPTSSISFPYAPDKSWLGFHFSLSIFLLTPLYWIKATPEWLILAHTACISGSAIPIFYSCLRLKVTVKEAFLWSLIYLIFSNVIYSQFWEFHEQSLAVLFISFGMWAAISNNLKVFVISMILLFLTKEHYGLTVSAFGIFYGIYNKNYRVGIITFILGIIGFLLVILVIMPYFNGSQHSMFLDKTQVGNFHHLARYYWMKWPLPSAIGYGLMLLFSQENILLYCFLLVPILFLPLARLLFIVPLIPETAINSLSDFANPRIIGTYYWSSVNPILIIAACAGSIWVADKFKKINRIDILKSVIIINIFVLFIILPSPKAFILNEFTKENFFYPQKLQQLKKQFPEHVRLSVNSTIGTNFSQRKYIVSILDSYQHSDVVILYLGNNPYSHVNVFMPSKNIYPNWLGNVWSILNSPEWGVTYYDDQWVVIEKSKAPTIDHNFVKEKIVKKLKL